MAENDLIGKMIQDVPTPCLLVDKDKVIGNANRMIDRCQRLGVRLRPHMKTAKTLEAGEILTNGTKRCIVVSTLMEAEFFADGGFDDILYGCIATQDKLGRCVKLAERLEKFHLLVDSRYGLDMLEGCSLEGGKKWSVYLKVDCGYNRAGVIWDSEEAVTLGMRLAQSKHVTLLGLYTHCGNSYLAGSSEALQQVEIETTDRMLHLKNRLKDGGLENLEVGIGSTPSCSRPVKNLGVLTELHPGNYVFYDWMQVMIGSCSLDDVACRVATRVIGHYPEKGQMLIDAGFTAISHDGLKDNLPAPTGFCFIQDNPNLRLTKMTQEVGFIKATEGEIPYSQYPIGSMLYIYPYHSCATAAQHPVYYVHSGNKITDVWRPTRGW